MRSYHASGTAAHRLKSVSRQSSFEGRGFSPAFFSAPAAQGGVRIGVNMVDRTNNIELAAFRNRPLPPHRPVSSLFLMPW